MKIAKVFCVIYAFACKLAERFVNNKKKLTFEVPSLSPNERMRELVLHIVEKHKGATSFGMLKLNKILFFPISAFLR